MNTDTNTDLDTLTRHTWRQINGCRVYRFTWFCAYRDLVTKTHNVNTQAVDEQIFYQGKCTWEKETNIIF